jgi:hypothetical protein
MRSHLVGYDDNRSSSSGNQPEKLLKQSSLECCAPAFVLYAEYVVSMKCDHKWKAAGPVKNRTLSELRVKQMVVAEAKLFA